MNTMWYLFAAYIIIWIGICSYTLWIGRRQTRLTQAVEELHAQLQQADRS